MTCRTCSTTSSTTDRHRRSSLQPDGSALEAEPFRVQGPASTRLDETPSPSRRGLAATRSAAIRSGEERGSSGQLLSRSGPRTWPDDGGRRRPESLSLLLPLRERPESPPRRLAFGDSAGAGACHKDAVGGGPRWPLFDDVELLRRLRKRGLRVVKLRSARTTCDARRFDVAGFYPYLWTCFRLLLRYRLGGDVYELAAAYARGNPAS